MTLRNIFGYITVICILLAILARPLRLFFESIDFSDHEEWLLLHTFCGPWYGHLWLFNLENYWPFSGEIGRMSKLTASSWSLHQIVGGLGVTLYLIINTAFFGFLINLLQKLFWKR